MPLCCLWSDHSFRMLCSGHLARKLYVFWYHSFLIRTRISFQTSCMHPLAIRHDFFFFSSDISVDLAVPALLTGKLLIYSKRELLLHYSAERCSFSRAAFLLFQAYAFYHHKHIVWHLKASDVPDSSLHAEREGFLHTTAEQRGHESRGGESSSVV